MNVQAMKVGDKIETNVGCLTLNERVPYDSTARAYDPGFWATDADDKEYFVSEEGIVYNNSDEWPDVWDVAFGKVLTTADIARNEQGYQKRQRQEDRGKKRS